MNAYQTIEIDIHGEIATLWLNRPEHQNAVSITMLDELIDCFDSVEKNQAVRVVVLRGKGKSFCAGADLNRMLESSNLSYDENLSDGYRWAICLKKISSLSKPTIAVATGNVFGGGNGLLCTADIAVAESNAVFSFSEAKLGLAPSTIMPYVLSRLNEHKAKYLMFTCRKIDANEAQSINLVDFVGPEEELERKINSVISEMLSASPGSIKEIKSIIAELKTSPSDERTIEITANSIAKLKMSAESHEGISAFMQKRKPKWAQGLN